MTIPHKPLLVLPETYEDLVSELDQELAKMIQFVIPIENAEKELAVITQSMRHSGKVVFLLGIPGIGKSTFIQSLTWRKFLPIPAIHEINTDSLGINQSSKKLDELYIKITEIVSAVQQGEKGLLTIVINYLEDFAGQSDESIRAFFRDINGLLRRNPVLIIWPTTQKIEIERVLKLVSTVSSTVFTENPILTFNGPDQDKFPTIARTTIMTFNPGLNPTDFQLDEQDLTNILSELRKRHTHEQTIRSYLRMVKSEWIKRSGEIEDVLAKVPRFTEIWFVVCYPEAENVVGQFTRKSSDPDLAWDGDIRKFSEYITSGQKSSDWNNKKLLYALQGFFKVKVLFLPTHALSSCVAAFGKEASLKKYPSQPNTAFSRLVDQVRSSIPTRWCKPSVAIDFIRSSPLAYQIQNKSVTFGQRRGQSVSPEDARKLFMPINQFIASGGEGNDQPINESLSIGICKALSLDSSQVMVEKSHPWLSNIRPDIMLNINSNKIICLEMHYTADKRPFILANYVLDKMNTYMKELDAYMKSPRLFSDF